MTGIHPEIAQRDGIRNPWCGSSFEIEGGSLRKDTSITDRHAMVGTGFIRAPDERPRRHVHLRNAMRSRRRVVSVIALIAFTSLALLIILPADETSARPNREGGGCGAPDGCHSGAQTATMMTVTGLPTGSYVPGQQYTLMITLTDTNGATGENAFDLLVTAGSLSTTDSNAEVQTTPTSGYTAEASANDAVTPMRATSWTVLWTAPLSGSATVEVWSVMGDGATGTLDIWDHETSNYTAIPEFPTLLLAIIAVVCALVLASRMTKRKT
jgi:hypothetical protein